MLCGVIKMNVNDKGQNVKSRWLSSIDTKKALRISSCELMHMRERGELKFEKRGNAYFYNIESQKVFRV